MVRLSLFESASSLYFGPHFPVLGVGEIAPNVPEIGQFSIRDASQERRDPAELPVSSLFHSLPCSTGHGVPETGSHQPACSAIESAVAGTSHPLTAILLENPAKAGKQQVGEAHGMRTFAGVRLAEARLGPEDPRASGESSSPFEDLCRTGRLGPGVPIHLPVRSGQTRLP